VGNYDYSIDYVFQQDGTIRVAVGATGIDAVKGVASSGSYANSLLTPDDPPFRRNAYLAYQLCVTPYAPGERYAGGHYAMMSDGSDTLDTWTARDRAIGSRDIVAWFTMGFHHIPRMEDWPVMPTHWSSFSLMPRNFFANNPALTVPNER